MRNEFSIHPIARADCLTVPIVKWDHVEVRNQSKSPSMSCRAMGCAHTSAFQHWRRVACGSRRFLSTAGEREEKKHKTIFQYIIAHLSRLVFFYIFLPHFVFSWLCTTHSSHEKARMLRRPTLEYHRMTLKIALYIINVGFLHLSSKKSAVRWRAPNVPKKQSFFGN